MGGSSDPSVLRSPGATPQKGRAAHGPRHPAVTSPPRQCYFCVRFRLFGFSGILLGFIFGVLSLWGWETVGLAPFKTCPLLGKLFVVLSFFSGCLVDFVVVALSLFLSLSLSQALGKPKPRLGFGFPLVFSASWTSTTPSTRTLCSASLSRSSPAPAFFPPLAWVLFGVWFLLSCLSVCLPVHAR